MSTSSKSKTIRVNQVYPSNYMSNEESGLKVIYPKKSTPSKTIAWNNNPIYAPSSSNGGKKVIHRKSTSKTNPKPKPKPQKSKNKKKPVQPKTK